MAYQFVHMECFSRKGSKGRSTSFVFGEARRDPAASLHVATPAPPLIVYGVSVDEVERMHDAAADAARTTPKGGKERHVRQDQHTLLTVVASHPATMEAVRGDAAMRAEVERWERLTVAWLREQYGDRLSSVVRHEDETRWHVHAYVLPDDPAMRATALHPGQSATSAVMLAGPAEDEDSKALNKRGDREYKRAMREWQDSYHAAVAQPCGLTRLGPAGRRLSRTEWQREKVQARALRASLDRAAVVKSKVESFVATKKSETESLVATAASEAAALRADADAAQADAVRRLAEAKTATDAAKAVHDAAVAEQQKARSMMSRVRQEAAKVRAASARLQRLPSMLRTALDGLRQSRVADRIRATVAGEMDRLRDQASSAERRADAADKRASAAESLRWKAEERARTLDGALAETAVQRDAARREVQRLRPPEPEPSLGPGFGPRPSPGRR
ncbi:plasmid recombination protein [Agrobacterium sp. BT-220-3]|nr:plasmid recombination protein [Agrobacterium sp. BT-220-3]